MTDGPPSPKPAPSFWRDLAKSLVWLNCGCDLSVLLLLLGAVAVGLAASLCH